MKRTGSHTQSEMLKARKPWNENGKLFWDRFALKTQFPEFANEYFKAYFVVRKGVTYLEVEGDNIPVLLNVEYRSTGKSVDCILVFDGEGKGVIFHEQGGICYSEKDFPLSFDELENNRFVHNKVIYFSKIRLTKPFPEFKSQVIEVKGDGEWEIKGKKVEAVASMRCGGECTGILVFAEDGNGLWFIN